MRSIWCVIICVAVGFTACSSVTGIGNDVGGNTPNVQTAAAGSDLLSYFGEKSYEPEGRMFEGREWKNNGPHLKVGATLTVTLLRRFADSAVYRMTFVIQPLNGKYPPHDAILYVLVARNDLFGLLKEEAESHDDLSSFGDRSRLRGSSSSSEFQEGMWHSTVTSDGAFCEYSSVHQGGHYSCMKWQNNRGLVEYSFGYGAERDGLKLRAK